jgi:hypothetical protein
LKILNEIIFKNMKRTLEQVAEFHTTFQHPVLPSPQIATEGRATLRKKLIAEEFKELCDAIDQKDIVLIADALCDLQYVLTGTVLEFGLKEAFPELFDEVQRSNMSKACTSVEEAEATLQDYRDKELNCPVKEVGKHHNPSQMHYEEKDGKFLVYRTADRKTLKSINYSKADFAGILSKYTV